ncbi:MAG: hypothetical protein N2561_02720 [Bacteroidetes bacterium]|nr:hypothetical protein [Rhodothermia bacterium]MCS7155574.1 hypothetical protein [Bacteroidota bacterium]MCX7906432.1 hypothetical protein [Bacteroidota bacterium]MDW8137286.1 hypothetical protein [Bacteroidota bacterium]MDW8284844.1 hypothetical protein [Bacteroidota bacterium]
MVQIAIYVALALLGIVVVSTIAMGLWSLSKRPLSPISLVPLFSPFLLFGILRGIGYETVSAAILTFLVLLAIVILTMLLFGIRRAF